ncbi:stress enhanced protein 1, chloroplastic-like [Andrographis paniculata]|uniref:stress enhanced protein 1, chloroplastic-like n=1 Tax=Andrographis paniculata TaxID=175694 RepID=UPI0021E8ECD2|nr:stress enhanced protein 1, chloroplastic-like [Andrographis paniculata]
MAAVAAAGVVIFSSLRLHTVVNDIYSARTVLADRVRPKFGTSFAAGSPLSSKKPAYQKIRNSKYRGISIRAEDGDRNEGNGLNAWLGRLAMVGFASAVVVEIRTGKGLLENIGVIAPLPTLVLTFTAVLGVLTALFIFQSGSED